MAPYCFGDTVPFSLKFKLAKFNKGAYKSHKTRHYKIVKEILKYDCSDKKKSKNCQMGI